MSEAQDPQPNEPRLWLGCGCGLLVLPVMGSLLLFSTLSYRQAKQMEEGSLDRQARRAKIDKVLRPHELPDGYHPLGGISIPVFMRLAVLTDEAPGEAPVNDERPMGQRFQERGFVYSSLWSFRRNDDRIRSYFEEEGGADAPTPGKDGRGGEMRVDFSVAFEGKEVVRRGAVAIDGGEALYLARRGSLELSGGSRPGIATLLYFACEKGRRMRLGLWFGPDPAPEKESADTDFTETPADPEAIRELVGHFGICEG